MEEETPGLQPATDTDPKARAPGRPERLGRPERTERPESPGKTEEPEQTGSRSFLESVRRFGVLPAEAGRAAEIRQTYGLAAEAGISHYDSATAGIWLRAEDTGNKDLLNFLRDTGGEKPSSTNSRSAGPEAGTGDLTDLTDSGLRKEDLEQLTDSELLALYRALERKEAEADG